MKKLLLFLLLSVSLSAQVQTPSQVYLAYRDALPKATSLEALQPFLAAPVVAQVTSTSSDQKPKLLDTLKTLNAAYQVRVTAETDTPDGHVLIVDGVNGQDRPIRGTVDLVKEPSGWKIVKESWHGR